MIYLHLFGIMKERDKIMTEQIKQDIQEWQKTTGIETMSAIGIKEDSFVLDIGCGDGIFTISEGYACMNGAVIGVDLDSQPLHVFRENAAKAGLENVMILQRDIIHSPIDIDACDVITMNDLIHEFDDISELIKHIKPLLKDDGIFAVTPFHLNEDEIKNKVDQIIQCGMKLDHIVENGGIHFGKVKHMNGAWKRLSDFERGNIYCFQKDKEE